MKYSQYESIERKRKEERESKERARMKEKEGANIIGGGLRRETWIHPGDGRRVRRTTSANEARLSHASDLEELSQLTSVEVPISVSTSYLPNSFQKLSFHNVCLLYSDDKVLRIY